jgi:hypothetical protein
MGKMELQSKIHFASSLLASRLLLACAAAPRGA